eukprot:COSAG04_NODE_1645_length_6065_cov_12.892558_2_plen_97_part_00
MLPKFPKANLQGPKHFRPADCVHSAVLGETEAAAKAKKAEDKAAAKDAKDKAKEDAAEEKRQSQILEAGDNPMAESDEEGEGDEDEEAPDLNLGGL